MEHNFRIQSSQNFPACIELHPLEDMLQRCSSLVNFPLKISRSVIPFSKTRTKTRRQLRHPNYSRNVFQDAYQVKNFEIEA